MRHLASVHGGVCLVQRLSVHSCQALSSAPMVHVKQAQASCLSLVKLLSWLVL